MKVSCKNESGATNSRNKNINKLCINIHNHLFCIFFIFSLNLPLFGGKLFLSIVSGISTPEYFLTDCTKLLEECFFCLM